MQRPVYDRQTLTVIAGIATGLVIALFAINAALVLLSAAWPNWLPRQFFGVDFIVDNRQRAAGRSPSTDTYRTGHSRGRRSPVPRAHRVELGP